MIKVSINYYNHEIKSLVVKGHAQAGPYGQDLVCAGVSAIMNGAFNGFDHLVPQDVDLTVGDNVLKIEVKNFTPQVKQLITMLSIQLMTIAKQYPQNIQIREVR